MVYITSSRKKVLLDREDFLRLEGKKLYRRPTGYISLYINRKPILLHRFIMNAPKGTFIDHINRKPYDNRKCNLRFATMLQNSWNSKAKGKIGLKGVHRQLNSYRAQIRFHGRLISIGSYPTKELAYKAYQSKARELFGEFAYAP